MIQPSKAVQDFLTKYSLVSKYPLSIAPLKKSPSNTSRTLFNVLSALPNYGIPTSSITADASESITYRVIETVLPQFAGKIFQVVKFEVEVGGLLGRVWLKESCKDEVEGKTMRIRKEEAIGGKWEVVKQIRQDEMK